MSLLAWAFVLILVLLAFQYLPNFFSKNPTQEQVKKEDSLRNVWAASKAFLDKNNTNTATKAIPENEVQLVDFDPNAATYDELLHLGFPPKTAHIFINYREKIHGFKHIDQIQKVYTLEDDLFQKIKPHIKLTAIPGNEYAYNAAYKNKFDNYKSFEPRQNNTKSIIEINSANELSFKTLYGIGDYYAHKIVDYRNQLGGFITLDQLKETGISDSLLATLMPQLRINPNSIQKININQATEADFAKHPYFKRFAKGIVQFRTDITAFQSLEQLRQIPAMNTAAFKKMVQYASL